MSTHAQHSSDNTPDSDENDHSSQHGLFPDSANHHQAATGGTIKGVSSSSQSSHDSMAALDLPPSAIGTLVERNCVRVVSGMDQTSAPMQNPNGPYKSYRKRYFLLIIFILLSMSNAFQWIEYAIIETIVTEYYGITTFWVNCTSVVYMVSYILGIMPATWLLNHYGLRYCLIFASFGNAVGAWMKCFSVAPNLFYVGMIGQTIVASSQLFILNIPPLLAATWFPSHQVISSTAYGVFGNQVGIALGFLLPPWIVPPITQIAPNTSSTTASPNTSSLATDEVPPLVDLAPTEQGLRYLFYSVAILTTVIFCLITLFFRDRPKTPPSHAAAYSQIANSKQTFSKSLSSLFKNKNFVLVLVSYGLNTGVFYAISTVLSQLITRAIGEKYLEAAGNMGFAITLAGIFGSLICGYILSWSRQFKLVTLIIYVLSLVGTILFSVGLLVKSVELLYVICIALGFFMTGYLPIGFELAAEVSYPQPEGTSAGLLNAAAQVSLKHFKSFGFIFVSL